MNCDAKISSTSERCVTKDVSPLSLSRQDVNFNVISQCYTCTRNKSQFTYQTGNTRCVSYSELRTLVSRHLLIISNTFQLYS